MRLPSAVPRQQAHPSALCLDKRRGRSHQAVLWAVSLNARALIPDLRRSDFPPHPSPHLGGILAATDALPLDVPEKEREAENGLVRSNN